MSLKSWVIKALRSHLVQTLQTYSLFYTASSHLLSSCSSPPPGSPLHPHWIPQKYLLIAHDNAVPSAWNVLPEFSALQSQLRCHLLRGLPWPPHLEQDSAGLFPTPSHNMSFCIRVTLHLLWLPSCKLYQAGAELASSPPVSCAETRSLAHSRAQKMFANEWTGKGQGDRQHTPSTTHVKRTIAGIV